jgi:hypothetical protein
MREGTRGRSQWSLKKREENVGGRIQEVKENLASEKKVNLGSDYEGINPVDTTSTVV